MIPKLKICGMRDANNIEQVAALNPDFMGFIFYPPSPRYAGEMSPAIMKSLPSCITKTGVFVNETEKTIRSTASKYRLDAIQLHGDESPELCSSLKNEYLVIKAFGIKTLSDFDNMTAFECKCDYFLFDTKSQTRGGTGSKFDHSLINYYTLDTPFFISGGISPDDDLATLPKHDKLYGVDINSKFETCPGIKDLLLVNSFIQQLKS